MAIVALAGLPGTGKSTLARLLAERLDAPLLDKDRVRAALFGPNHVEYSRVQDDFCCRLLYETAAFVLQGDATRHVVLDGRTYSRSAQVLELVAAAERAKARLRLIECTSPPEVARLRLARDAHSATHPAANRSPELYDRLAAAAETITVEKLVVPTHPGPPESHLAACLEWIESPSG